MMAHKPDSLAAVVIGAGWAGLGVSAALKSLGVAHHVLERRSIGETWRTQRWNSFRMNTPNSRSVMPGDIYHGPDPDGFLTRDEFVTLLEEFAARHRLPVEVNAPVTELTHTDDGTYRLVTPQGEWGARNVVIATGSLNRPIRPQCATTVPSSLFQIDASDYRSPGALPEGAILVVGNGQSGGQIAENLVEAGRRVFLATGHIGRLTAAIQRTRRHDVAA